MSWLNFVQKAKQWWVEDFVFDRSEKNRMGREAAALGYGLNGQDYNRPPWQPVNTTINQIGNAPPQGSAAPTQPGPPTTPAPAAPSPPNQPTGGYGLKHLIAAGLVPLLAGGIGVGGYLAGKGGPTPGTAPATPAVTQPATQPGGLNPASQQIELRWKLVGFNPDGTPKWATTTAPIAPTSPGK